jgi:hypothetical protein
MAADPFNCSPIPAPAFRKQDLDTPVTTVLERARRMPQPISMNFNAQPFFSPCSAFPPGICWSNEFQRPATIRRAGVSSNHAQEEECQDCERDNS